MSPDRRITADSFRLLTARLKKRPSPLVQTELQPEPEILASLEIIEETAILAPVAGDESPEDFASEDIEFAFPQANGKKPWAWLTPADPVAEVPAVDSLFETETPMQAVDEAEAAPEPEPWREIPFEELFASAGIAEPELASPELEEVLVETGSGFGRTRNGFFRTYSCFTRARTGTD